LRGGSKIGAKEEGVWGRKFVAPVIPVCGSRLDDSSCHFTPGNNPRYTLNIRLDVPQWQSERFGEEINATSLPEIKR
jgi:hypothetical protein